MGNFSTETLLAVWKKGGTHPLMDPTEWRYDAYGTWMRLSHYGQQTDYGWEVDHIRPVSHGGDNELINLQPLHWRNNRAKSDN